ncbi:Copper-sensing transcriptional repressor CsoR [bacterium HR11]|nr:Copper-sensing transcriptional repressor CsoR [bacterium HR11]
MPAQVRRRGKTPSTVTTAPPADRREVPEVLRTIYLPKPVRRRLIHRIHRIQGQLEAIRREIARGQCADDLLIQVAAVWGAVKQLAAKILENHLVDCARTCMREGRTDEEVLERIARALSVILRQS